MYPSAKALSINRTNTHDSLQHLYNTLLRLSFFNLLLVALIGVLMRSFPFLHSFPLEYKNILHGHSHFAFGGWVMPMLLALFIKYFPDIASRIKYHHWRKIAVLMLASAYGMLVSFPLQGYKAVSIFFSTCSIISGYYMAYVVWKELNKEASTTSLLFIKWGLIYFAISALGPFATGPLIVMGKQGTPLYFDAIYFYLHFQYNGFFTFFVLAFVYQMLQKKGGDKYGKRVFKMFNLACMPTFALSVLWNEPPIIFYVMGGVGALLQLTGLCYFIKDIQLVSWKKSFTNGILLISFFAFAAKLVLQLLSAVPAIAAMAYHQRNFVIAYLHLVLLGFISTFFFAQTLSHFKNNQGVQKGFQLFIFSFITTEALLAANAFSIAIPYYTQLLLSFTLFFPASVFVLYLSSRHPLQSAVPLR